MNKNNNFLIFAAFLLSLIIAFSVIFGIKFKYENDANRLYKQGSKLYQEEKYSDAYFNFKQIKGYSNIYELALLKQFQCASNLSDKKTAYATVKKLLKKSKNKAIRPYLLYNEAVLRQELKSPSKKKYKYIYENYPQNDYAVASGYKLAELIKSKDINLAKEYYISYLEHAPLGRYAKSSLETLLNNKEILTDQDFEIIGDAFLKNSMKKEALEAYLKTDFSKNWFNVSKCYKDSNLALEKETILKGLSLEDNYANEKDITSAINRLQAITKIDKVALYQDLYTNYKNEKTAPSILYNLAEASKSIRSIKMYETIVKNYPDSIWAPNSAWEIFWYNYKLSRYATCEQIAKNFMLKYPQTQDAPRVAYWYGRVLLKEKRNKQAKELFYKIIDDYPLSYYSFLSMKQLKTSKAKNIIIKKQILSYDTNSISKNIFKDKFLYKLAQYEEYSLLEDFKINDPYIQSWLLNKKQDYPRSIKLAQDEFLKNFSESDTEAEKTKKDKLNFSSKELKLIYPVNYEDIVNYYAKDYKISPYLFLSLIREESHFDKNAKSSVGAVGLSQLMKPTASFIEKTNVSTAYLLNPENNIKTGMKYFNYLTKEFNNNVYLSILAYNAGPGSVKKWLENPLIASGDIDEFVENIPYLETKNYIKKILSSYFIYVNIYSSKFL